MNNSSKLIANAVAALLALGASAAANSAFADDEERCYGVAKAGQNACNNNPAQHTCASRAKVSNDANDFIYVPKGSCVKIHGKLEPAVAKVKATGK